MTQTGDTYVQSVSITGNNTVTEQPTMLFRWRLGQFNWLTNDTERTLEQKWQILEHEWVSGKLLSMKEEWRPIPVELPSIAATP